MDSNANIPLSNVSVNAIGRLFTDIASWYCLYKKGNTHSDMCSVTIVFPIMFDALFKLNTEPLMMKWHF